MRAGIQLFASDLEDWGNNVVTLDWAYGDYRIEDWFGFRFGRVKRPSGLYGQIRNYDTLRVPVILPQGLYFDPFRELTTTLNGVVIYGNIPVGDGANFEYNAWAGEGSITKSPGSANGGIDD